MPDVVHVFGGAWTDRKLNILGEYLGKYTTALSKQKFKLGYIDAFAGSGWRERSADAKKEALRLAQMDACQCALPGLESDVDDEPLLEFLDGSARVALQTTPSFDKYVFIEAKRSRCLELQQLRSDFPGLAERIDIVEGDANTEIQRMCHCKWGTRRAVVFLDPYGTEVKWETIEAIAKTRAIDLWVLFPLGAVNRMVTQSGTIPPAWKACLDELLGTAEWYSRFYQADDSPSLFESRGDRLMKRHMDVIAEFFLERLRGCFAGVAGNPAVLRNSKNSPLYLFCFAAANPDGSALALRIAERILKNMRD